MSLSRTSRTFDFHSLILFHSVLFFLRDSIFRACQISRFWRIFCAALATSRPVASIEPSTTRPRLLKRKPNERTNEPEPWEKKTWIDDMSHISHMCFTLFYNCHIFWHLLFWHFNLPRCSIRTSVLLFRASVSCTDCWCSIFAFKKKSSWKTERRSKAIETLTSRFGNDERASICWRKICYIGVASVETRVWQGRWRRK